MNLVTDYVTQQLVKIRKEFLIDARNRCVDYEEFYEVFHRPKPRPRRDRFGNYRYSSSTTPEFNTSALRPIDISNEYGLNEHEFLRICKEDGLYPEYYPSYDEEAHYKFKTKEQATQFMVILCLCIYRSRQQK